MQSKRAFFMEAIKDIKVSGTIAPSSKYLINKILRNIDFSDDNIIVEYGPGNGIITQAILDNLNDNSLLICFEINKIFADHLQRIHDPRLIIIPSSAATIKQTCEKMKLTNVDYFISSLPLTNIPNTESEKILQESYAVLKPTGYFIQYQYSLTYFKKLKKIFQDKVDLQLELRNIPPAFIYKCKK